MTAAGENEMPLPAPPLDNLSFQDIVDESKRRIGLRCPEWTDHNVSDPGVTLIELFAWMTEQTLYRLNQVPERMHVKFLDLLGVQLQPPAPARADLRFRLSAYIEDRENDPRHNKLLPARDTVAATVRTDFEEAIEFATDADLRFVRPGLAYAFRLPAASSGSPDDDKRGVPADVAGAVKFAILSPPREIENDEAATPGIEAPPTPIVPGFAVFSDTPTQDDTFWLGFTEEVARNLIQLQIECVRTAAVGLDEDFPASVWEAWNPALQRWERLEVAADTTRGLNRNGVVELVMPPRLDAMVIGETRARWIRCRYTVRPDDLPPRPGISAEERRPVSVYQSPPQIRRIIARTVGGQVSASNCVTLRHEEIGQSDGTPGQAFVLRARPVLPRDPEAAERLRVGPANVEVDEMDVWAEVKDFSASGPNDRHYTLDSLSGELRFGPLVATPDGTPMRYGLTPERGATLIFEAYRVGGGVRGNVRENEITIVKSSIDYIAEVANPRRAAGGSEQETLEHAKIRAQQEMRRRDRAVTAEDFEAISLEASPAIARVKCLPPDEPGPGERSVRSGVVRVLLIPQIGPQMRVPSPRDLQIPLHASAAVRRALNERRLLTTVIEPMAPEYVFVSTEIALFAAPDAEPLVVQENVRRSLEAFFHPLTGGFDGSGWPFGRKLSLSDLYARIQSTPGIAYLQSAPRIYLSRIENAEEGVLGIREEWNLEKGDLELESYEVLATRAHQVTVRPIRQ